MKSASGRVNAHTHLYSGLVPFAMPDPGVTPGDLLLILKRLWWRLDRALDAEALRAAADYYVAEALLAGTTALVDHHESPAFIEGSLDVLADACQELGMRAVLCYGASERNDGRAEARRGLAECRRFLESNTRPLVTGVFGVHASFSVSDDTLREAGRLAREAGTVVHLHVAEDRVDVTDARKRGYQGVIDRLERMDALPAGSILAHGVHLTAAEVARCEERGWWLVQNPRSNRANGVGYAGRLGANGRVALGTDGFPSDLLAELSAFQSEARAHGDDPTDGARRLAAGARLLEEMSDADGDDPSALDLATGTVTVAGCPVVQEGRLTTGDSDEIRARAAEQAARLWRRMEEVDPQ